MFEFPPPYFEYTGNGTITFDNEHNLDARLSIKLLVNGKIVGNIEFPYHPRIFEFAKRLVKFSLRGTERNNGYQINAESCRFGSISDNILSGRSKGLFTSQYVSIQIPDWTTRNLREEVLINFGIINVHKIPTTCVESKIGILSLKNYTDIEERQTYMKTFKSPLITSSVLIVAKPEVGQTLDDLVINAKEVVEDFLKITSFSQGVWHDWAFLSVQTNDRSPNVIYQKLRSPVLKPPSFKLLMPPPYSSEFVRTCFRGYSRELDEEYGFNAALEWYLERDADAAIDTKFLHSTTCLELLMDKLLSEKRLDIILSDEDFNSFYESICKSSASILREMGKDNKTIESVKNSLKGTQKLSFVNKIRLLINYWGITIGDTRIKVSDIREVRNKITHNGRYKVNSDSDIENFIHVSNGLQTLLTRVFLAMLRYDKFYQDYGVQYNSNGESNEWINFKEVCKKLGNPSFDMY